MEVSKLLPDSILREAIERSQYIGRELDECRLCLAEMMLKAACGRRNSHTEEEFMSWCEVLKKDRTPNYFGRQFLKLMYYAPSNRKPEAFILMQKYRG